LEFSQEPVADLLRERRKVHVEKARLAGVDRGTEMLVRLVGRPPGDRFGQGEFAVKRLPGRGTGHHTDLERASRLVLRLRALCQRRRNGFGSAGRGEPAEANRVVVVDQCGRFIGGHQFVSECHVRFLYVC